MTPCLYIHLAAMNLHFDNRFVRELPGDLSGKPHSRQTPGVCWAAIAPGPASHPTLLAHSPEVARLLDIGEEEVRSTAFLDAFSGNRLLPGMQPYASCYGGHQFGNWAGQLGDGRAIGLGEIINRNGQRLELQLKGAGATPYSRRADGRAVLRSSLREFLCSEAMHHLGIPTTRALSLITSGDGVQRDMLYDGNPAIEPGAILCRVAPSFLRFGHFEILAARGEHALLRRLVEFTLSRDFPGLRGDARFADWFRLVCERTATLVVEWLRVGFVHGVMNTDNMSILGLTIDYGPYGWVDNFDPGWTPNTTDAQWRRYCLGQQPDIARWNLQRLAEALAPVAPEQAALDAGLAHFDATLQARLGDMLAAKFGWLAWQQGDAALVNDIFELMQRCEVDMTEFFRALANVAQPAPDVETLRSAFYRDALYQNHRELFADWLARYAARLAQQDDTDAARRERMNRVNPRFVLRNYLAQQAIEAATQQDTSWLEKLLAAARRPYDDCHLPELIAKRPDWALNKPGCSMLSCSS
ncbi:MAG: YdiU family protein [Gallionella sp.]|nr:YdiU family protein [Gallionella sp.]MDD4945656.1 YdiU family protein [Gallionella sp.]